jgi:hypothetical protein
MWRVMFVALAAFGCGSKTATTPVADTGSAPAPPDAGIVVDAPLPLDQNLPQLATRSVALYESVVAAFREAGTDCAAAATRLTALRAEYADVVAANAKVLHEGRARELKAALAKHDTQLDAAAQAIMAAPTLGACVKDEAFTRAFDDLVGAP